MRQIHPFNAPSIAEIGSAEDLPSVSSVMRVSCPIVTLTVFLSHEIS